MKEVEFTFVQSGDGECFCYNVDHKTYVKYKMFYHEENEHFDKNMDGTYRLYPGDFIPGIVNKATSRHHKVKVKMIFEVLDE